MEGKRGQGRAKRVFSPEELVRLEEMAAWGVSVRRMAVRLGVGHATLERRMADTPEVKEAIEKGRAHASCVIGKTAFELAASGKCPAMTMFWLKCRERWRENDFDAEVIPVDFKELRANV